MKKIFDWIYTECLIFLLRAMVIIIGEIYYIFGFFSGLFGLNKKNKR